MGHGDFDCWLVKINQTGNAVWNQTYGGPRDDFAYGLTAASDGYVLAGETHSFGEGDADAFAVKTNLSGNLLWEKAYGGKQFDVANAVISSNSGGYVFVGTTFSYGAGNRDFWVFKVDNNGNFLWSRTWGTSGFEEAYSVLETGQNEYVLAGWLGGLTPPPYDFCLVKISVELGGSPDYLTISLYAVVAAVCVFLALLILFKLRNKRK